MKSSLPLGDRQLIVDRVRELVQAQYAAIGIVDAEGAIERFITSGISDEARERIGQLVLGQWFGVRHRSIVRRPCR